MKNKINLFKFSIFLGLQIFSSIAFSQAPEKMSYQSVLRGTNNALVTNQNVRVKISLLQGNITGSAAYVEEHNTSTNANGLVSLSIGGGTLISGSFSGIDWANGPYFVKMEADPTGGTNYTISGTTQLLSVPYALHAKTAESVVGGSTGGGGFTHYVGEQFGGGVIFHLWKDSQGLEHGLIVNLYDLGYAEWSNLSALIGASAQSFWDGKNNSIAIANQVGHISSAAKLCLDLNEGGEDDWYLPAGNELSALWHNLFLINKTLSNISGTDHLNPKLESYWSSTERNSTKVWNISWLQGNLDAYGDKAQFMAVRAIRSF
jgi:hypothetical protein